MSNTQNNDKKEMSTHNGNNSTDKHTHRHHQSSIKSKMITPKIKVLKNTDANQRVAGAKFKSGSFSYPCTG